MLSQVLWKSLGKKVGLFTSPHFIAINERFQINGVPIADTELEKYYGQVIQLGEKHDIPLSFFEIQVAVMILYFRDEKVDYAVVEVGLGGTYDGTNIFKKPLACFITSIALEHTHVLGKTRASILKNKLGIIKKGTTLYTPLKNKLIEETCRKENVSLRILTKHDKKKTNLAGNHQEKNAGLVFEALKDLGFNTRKIEAGLQNIYNP
jgi:dihydrofolate synthase/folylpolyglutamate synthase